MQPNFFKDTSCSSLINSFKVLSLFSRIVKLAYILYYTFSIIKLKAIEPEEIFIHKNSEGDLKNEVLRIHGEAD